MNELISREDQMLVIEKLYRSSDAITSTKKFNEKYGQNLGEKAIKLTDFGRIMKQTDFTSYDVERFTKEITNQDIDLESL